MRWLGQSRALGGDPQATLRRGNAPVGRRDEPSRIEFTEVRQSFLIP